jgi:hypothetical protein
MREGAHPGWKTTIPAQLLFAEATMASFEARFSARWNANYNDGDDEPRF